MVSFEWKFNKEDIESIVPKLNNMKFEGGLWKSPMFRDSDNRAQWYIELKKEKSSNALMFTLHLANTEISDDLNVFIQIYIRDIDGGQSGQCYSNIYGRWLFNKNTKVDLCDQNIMHSDLFIFLTCLKKIKLVCYLDAQIEINDRKNEIVRKEMPEFEKLFDTDEFSDFVIVADSGREFKVHKNILCSRSSVFRSMIITNMKEKYDGRVEIKNFPEKVVQELLRYIYCGRVENLTVIVKDLLIASDQYMLNDLKILCLHELCKDLRLGNAMELLSMAYDLQVEEVKPKIIDFIVSKIEAIVDMNDYRACNNADIMRDILCKCIKYKIVRKV